MKNHLRRMARFRVHRMLVPTRTMSEECLMRHRTCAGTSDTSFVVADVALHCQGPGYMVRLPDIVDSRIDAPDQAYPQSSVPPLCRSRP